jgi:DNA-directed RNA polymerase subunit K
MGEPNIRQLPYGELMKYTRFEKARIIGARALQISFGAPILVDHPADMLDPIDIAMLEFDRDMIPITVSRD